VTEQQLHTEFCGFLIQEDLTAKPVQAMAAVHTKQTDIAVIGVFQQELPVQLLKFGQVAVAAQA
jgi:hypothetical protein